MELRRVAPDSSDERQVRQASTLLCFSHLRWDLVFQRPQHFMVRAAQSRPVFFWEEPICVEQPTSARPPPRLELQRREAGVVIATPMLGPGLDEAESASAQRHLLDELVREQGIVQPTLWYYTPQALLFSDHMAGFPVIYDCMDELSAFRGAHPALPVRERELLQRADLVFTGGDSLYEAKRRLHPAVYLFRSGVDIAHFLPARSGLPEPDDQAPIPHPRLGFYGVLDERLDTQLLAAVADARPDWHIVLVGPVVKIRPDELPRRANIHHLGPKPYGALPTYLSGWDVALMPFARNEATRFISPTKTPEYLAGGRPVVSAPIVDVVRQYESAKAVLIAETAEEFVVCTERALALSHEPERWLAETDRLLESMSWDLAWRRMAALIDAAAQRKAAAGTVPPLGKRAACG